MSAIRCFRHPRLWLAGWVLVIVAVVISSLLPANKLPIVPIDHFDKVEHFLAYALLGTYAVMLFAHRRAQALAVLALIALGVALEFAQSQVTGNRIASSADALANAFGALAALSLAPTRWAEALLRLESRWLSPRG